MIKLTKELFGKLLTAERELHDLVPEFAKGEECGVDCQEFRRIHEEAMQRIEALKKNYGPNSK